MSSLTKHTAGKVKARVMSGKTSKGEPLTYNQLKPDIERLREYAQHSSEKFGRKLIKQLDERVQVLEREEPESAGASETTTEDVKSWHEVRERNVEELKTKVKGKLLTATTYCKVRTEFKEKKRADLKDLNGVVQVEGSALSKEDLDDHAMRLLIYASTMKQASRRAALEREVLESESYDVIIRVKKGQAMLGQAGQKIIGDVKSVALAHVEVEEARNALNRAIDKQHRFVVASTDSQDEFIAAFNTQNMNLKPLLEAHTTADMFRQAAQEGWDMNDKQRHGWKGAYVSKIRELKKTQTAATCISKARIQERLAHAASSSSSSAATNAKDEEIQKLKRRLLVQKNIHLAKRRRASE